MSFARFFIMLMIKNPACLHIPKYQNPWNCGTIVYIYIYMMSCRIYISSAVPASILPPKIVESSISSSSSQRSISSAGKRRRRIRASTKSRLLLPVGGSLGLLGASSGLQWVPVLLVFRKSFSKIRGRFKHPK